MMYHVCWLYSIILMPKYDTSVYLSIYLSIYLSMYLSIYLSINQSISIYINLYQSISIYINLYQSISICIYIYIIYINLYQSISIYINLYQSISIYINLYQSISIYINLHHDICIPMCCAPKYAMPRSATETVSSDFVRVTQGFDPRVARLAPPEDLGVPRENHWFVFVVGIQQFKKPPPQCCSCVLCFLWCFRYFNPSDGWFLWTGKSHRSKLGFDGTGGTPMTLETPQMWTGWWLGHPSEKYMSSSVGMIRNPIFMGK